MKSCEPSASASAQVGPVNYAYLKFGPLAAAPALGLPPLMVVLGFNTTLHGATPQVLQSLATDRTVRVEPRPDCSTLAGTSKVGAHADAHRRACLTHALGSDVINGAEISKLLFWA